MKFPLLSSPLLSDPIRSDPKASPDSEDDAWAKLTFHFELSVGSIVLRKFSGGGASCQLDPNNAHDKKKRVHMSHTQTLPVPGRGGLFMGLMKNYRYCS